MKKIGRYEVKGLLGRGGMGAVYKVRHSALGKMMALKLLAPRPALVSLLGKDEIRRRFLGEAPTMAGLRHPHVAAVWDMEDGPDGLFFVMEYYCRNLGDVIGEGRDLEAETRRVPPGLALDLIGQTLSGLARLHQAGVVHRDVKPFNLLLTDDKKVKITDFGLSKLRGEESLVSRTLKVGSPFYAAPEQIRDPEHAGPEADLYSVGATLYRMVVGKPPPAGRPSLLNANLNQDWDEFLETSLAPDPARRWASTEKMMEALASLRETYLAGPKDACPAPAASFGRTGVAPRSEPKKVSPSEAGTFFNLDELGRPATYTDNDFEFDQARGLIKDRSTGLTWPTDGSPHHMTRPEAEEYAEQMNALGWGERDDWRLPTIDELLTLLRPPDELEADCLNPVFDRGRSCFWSADRRSVLASWYVGTDLGYVGRQDDTCYFHVRPVSSAS